MTSLASDLTSALRQIARHRAFSTIVIVTLALGIGATTTFFSILNAFLFRPLTFAEPDRVVAVRTFKRPDGAPSVVAYESVAELARNAPGLRSVLAYTSRGVNAAAGGSAERVVSTSISGDLFGLLGVSFGAGRPFLSEEYRSHAAVAVISAALRASNLIGTQIRSRHCGASTA